MNGCAGRSARYASMVGERGEPRFIPLCWSHYKVLVLKERSKHEMDSRPKDWMKAETVAANLRPAEADANGDLPRLHRPDLVSVSQTL